MCVLEAQDSPDAGNHDDGNSLGRDDSVPNANMLTACYTHQCRDFHVREPGREKTDGREDVNEHSQNHRYESLVEFPNEEHDRRVLDDKENPGAKQDEGKTLESTTCGVILNGEVQ